MPPFLCEGAAGPVYGVLLTAPRPGGKSLEPELQKEAEQSYQVATCQPNLTPLSVNRLKCEPRRQPI